MRLHFRVPQTSESNTNDAPNDYLFPSQCSLQNVEHIAVVRRARCKWATCKIMRWWMMAHRSSECGHQYHGCMNTTA